MGARGLPASAGARVGDRRARPVVRGASDPARTVTSPKRVEVHPQAVAEARAAIGWYRSRSDQAAVAFARELDVAIATILEAPDRWPRFAAGTRRFLLH